MNASTCTVFQWGLLEHWLHRQNRPRAPSEPYLCRQALKRLGGDSRAQLRKGRQVPNRKPTKDCLRQRWQASGRRRQWRQRRAALLLKPVTMPLMSFLSRFKTPKLKTLALGVHGAKPVQIA